MLGLIFGLAYVPHAAKVVFVHQKLARESKEKMGKTDDKTTIRAYDIRWPRLATLAAVDASQEGRLISRLEACHYNALENYPLAVAAVLGALIAGVDVDQVELHAAGYFCLRIVYTLIYAVNIKMNTAYTRSIVWAISLVLLFHLLSLAASVKAKA